MNLRQSLLPVLLLVSTASVGAEPLRSVQNPPQARVNYMLNCQGCHGPNGAGMTDGTVPALNNYMARFLHVQGGREFLVQVPGSANAGMSADALADVLNWMLMTLDPDHLPAEFSPYTAAEVEALRATPLQDVVPVRSALVQKLAALKLDQP